MDCFQGVVTEYLRADRSVFVNTECLIQLESGDATAKGRHRYCDAVAINFRESTAYLCEITYLSTMHSRLNRLQAWDTHGPLLRAAIERDCLISDHWNVQPWVFIPRARHPAFTKKMAAILKSNGDDKQMITPMVTYIKSVNPWNYRSWDRRGDAIQTDTQPIIPPDLAHKAAQGQ